MAEFEIGLISKSELMEKLEGLAHSYDIGCEWDKSDGVLAALWLLKKSPVVDAVIVPNCEECFWNESMRGWAYCEHCIGNTSGTNNFLHKNEVVENEQ